MKTLNLLLMLPLFLAAFLLSCEKEDVPENVDPLPEESSLEFREDDQQGLYLTDSEGHTLYFFARDVKGNSECSGGCTDNWPVFYQQDLQVGQGLDADQVGVITRADGSKQNTYFGWPLYYFAGDNNPGEINGDGAGGNWFVAKPNYDLMLAEQEIGGLTVRYLVEEGGRTLYFFTQDENDKSNCEGGCLDSWPPFSMVPNQAPSTISMDGFSSIPGNHGDEQITFDGRPLYFFHQDNERGQVNGQGVGGSWFVLSEDILNP